MQVNRALGASGASTSTTREPLPLKQRLSKALLEFSSSLAQSKGGGALVQVWMPEHCADGSVVLSAQGLPFAVVGVGDLLALFRCVSVRYRFATDVMKPTLMGAVGRVYATGEPEMSHDVQKYDKQVYLRVSEAQRCRVHSTMMVPVFSADSHGKPVAVFELVQSDKDCVFPAVMTWLKQCFEVVGLSTITVDPMRSMGFQKWPLQLEQGRTNNEPVTKLVMSNDFASPADTGEGQGNGGLNVAGLPPPKIEEVSDEAMSSNGNPPAAGTSMMRPAGTSTRVSNEENAAARQQQGNSGTLLGLLPPPPNGAMQSPTLNGVVNGLNGANGTGNGNGSMIKSKSDSTQQLAAWMAQNGVGPEALQTLKSLLQQDPTAKQLQQQISMQQQQQQQAMQNQQQQQQQQLMMGQNGMAPNGMDGKALAPHQLQAALAMAAFNGQQQQQQQPQQMPQQQQPQMQQQQVLMQVQLPMSGVQQAGGSGRQAGSGGDRETKEEDGEGEDISSDGDDDDSDDGEGGGRGHKNNRAGGGAGKRLRYEDLQSQFGLGLKEAASNLGICATTLKRACRRHGIKRWPRRQIVKLSKALMQMGYQGTPPSTLVQSAVTGQLKSQDFASAGAGVAGARPQQQQQQQQAMPNGAMWRPGSMGNLQMAVPGMGMGMTMSTMQPGMQPQQAGMYTATMGMPNSAMQFAMLSRRDSGSGRDMGGTPGSVPDLLVHELNTIGGGPGVQGGFLLQAPLGQQMLPSMVPAVAVAAAAQHGMQDGHMMTQISMPNGDFLDNLDMSVVSSGLINDLPSAGLQVAQSANMALSHSGQQHLAALHELFKNAPGAEQFVDLLSEDMPMPMQ